jgi:hypothetical protein
MHAFAWGVPTPANAATVRFEVYFFAEAAFWQAEKAVASA